MTPGRALLPLLLLGPLAGPPSAAAQGYRGVTTLRAFAIELRGLELDSLPEDAIAGEGIRRRLNDGTVVTCIPGDFCRWYGSGTVRTPALMTQEIELAAWPGFEGVSAHVHVRGRYGSDDDFWPRADQRLEAISVYLRYERSPLRLMAGRQFRTNGLGYYNFDGASVLWRATDAVRVDVFGGWSLARNLNSPRTGDLLEDADAFSPDERGLLVGVDVLGRLGASASAKLTYQREIRSDRAALYSERIAADLQGRMARAVVELSANYDLASRAVNEGSARVVMPVAGDFELAVQARRYRPFFELWTIWGAFSPVGYDEARATVGWSRPGGDLRIETGAAFRAYESTAAGAEFLRLEDDAWRGFGRGRWRRGVWFADGTLRADRGTGAARYGSDVAIGRKFGEGAHLTLRASTSQSFSEYRLGEEFTSGLGADGALRLGTITVHGSWGIHRIDVVGQPRVEDWIQQRASLSVSHRFGREPGMSDREGRHR